MEQQQQQQGPAGPSPASGSGQDDPQQQAQQQRRRRPRRQQPLWVTLTIRAVQTLLLLEAAGWAYTTFGAGRRRRRGSDSASGSSDSDGGPPAPADVLVDYLAGRVAGRALQGLGSEELLEAAAGLDSEDLGELGVTDGGKEIRELVDGIVQVRRLCRRRRGARGHMGRWASGHVGKWAGRRGGVCRFGALVRLEAMRMHALLLLLLLPQRRCRRCPGRTLTQLPCTCWMLRCCRSGGG